jgi:hypothetical protein
MSEIIKYAITFTIHETLLTAILKYIFLQPVSYGGSNKQVTYCCYFEFLVVTPYSVAVGYLHLTVSEVHAASILKVRV